MTTEGKDAIGALDYSPEERRILAKKSHSWHCEQCGCKNCEQLLPIPKKEHKEKENNNEDESKLAEMLVVSHDKKVNESNANINESIPTDDINNNNNNTTNIPTIDNNKNNDIINQDESIINTATMNPSPTPTNNTNAFNSNTVEINNTSVQQRVPVSNISNETENVKSVQPQQQQSNTSSNNTISSASASSSQANLNRNDNMNEERYKSFIDTLIIIVFTLLSILIYYRVNKDRKFWNDIE